VKNTDSVDEERRTTDLIEESPHNRVSSLVKSYASARRHDLAAVHAAHVPRRMVCVSVISRGKRSLLIRHGHANLPKVLIFAGLGVGEDGFLSWRPVGSDLIEAPAIGAAVRCALLLHCRSDALSKSVGARLKPLDHALILVGKLNWPPRYQRLRISRDRLPSLVHR
jgi:hypothetical protein